MTTQLTLPYPPSVNGYWRSFRGRQIISKVGRQYMLAVQAIVLASNARIRTASRLAVMIEIYPPDRRRRDIDNVSKAVLDSLGKAGVYVDDEQIDELLLLRRELCKPGKVHVTIEARD